MNFFFNLFPARRSAPVARERLQILLSYERQRAASPICSPFCGKRF